MAGVVAGALAFGAEALWAQHQAGPPAPAQAKPVGQTGELTGRNVGGQFPKGPQPAAGEVLRHQDDASPPLRRRSWQGSLDLQHPRSGTVPRTPQHAIFFRASHPTPAAASPGASDALCGFLGAHGGGGGAGWRPCKVAGGAEHGGGGATMHLEVRPAPQHSCGGSAHVPGQRGLARVGTAAAPALSCQQQGAGGTPCPPPSSPSPPPPWTHRLSSSAFPSHR